MATATHRALTNADVKRIVGDAPHMRLDQAERLTTFLEEYHLTSLLELGFNHGVSTCYMAGALERMGQGHITTIDLAGRIVTPTIHDLLAQAGLSHRVTIFAEPTSYTWRLMRMIEEDPAPRFDFCYIDGAHNWFVDGFAFFLVDKLLKPGGWLLLDDLDWSYSISPALRDSAEVRKMPEDERTTPQMRKVYDLLIKTHPDYHQFRIEGNWGFAQKRSVAAPAAREIVTERVVETRTVHVGLGAALLRVLKALKG